MLDYYPFYTVFSLNDMFSSTQFNFIYMALNHNESYLKCQHNWGVVEIWPTLTYKLFVFVVVVVEYIEATQIWHDTLDANERRVNPNPNLNPNETE